MPTLPNLLTLLRILLIPVMMGAFYAESPLGSWIAAFCFMGACITDYLDGFMARLLCQTSKLGQFLDPTADKLLVASTLFLLGSFGVIHKIHLIPALIILCREILVSGLREILVELSISMPVTRLAKWKTAIQMIALTFLMMASAAATDTQGKIYHFYALMHNIGLMLLWVSAFFTLFTGYHYLRAGLRHF